MKCKVTAANRRSNVFAQFLCLLLLVACGRCAHSQNPSTDREFSAQWTRYPVSALTSVAYPRDNFVELSRISAVRGGAAFDLQLLRGERWITLGREEAGALGLRADEISNVLRLPRFASTTVFAVYSPAGNELRIRVSRMEKRGDSTIRSYLADFTPHHGERWAAMRQYLTAIEAANPHRAGNNPFTRFRGAANDPVFYNMGWSAAQVAIGHAMRLYGANTGIIAVAETRIDTRTEESGNIFRRRVETTTTAYTRPRWFIALAESAQPDGFGAMICVGPNATENTCDAPEHIARSGVSIASWEGGNLPAQEEPLAQWSESRSGWSVLSIALVGITGATAMGLDPGMAMLLANAIDPLEINLAGDAPEVRTTDRRSPLSESTGTNVGHGSAMAVTPTSPEDAELRSRLRTRTRESIDAGFTGSRQMFVGACPSGLNASQCAALGMQPGMLRRPENQTQRSTTRRIQESARTCQQMGYAGEELRRCAALSRAPVVAPPQ